MTERAMATLSPENTYGRAEGTRTLRMIRSRDMPRVRISRTISGSTDLSPGPAARPAHRLLGPVPGPVRLADLGVAPAAGLRVRHHPAAGALRAAELHHRLGGGAPAHLADEQPRDRGHGRAGGDPVQRLRGLRLRLLPLPRPHLVFGLVLATMMLPAAVTMIPNYL